MVTLDPKKGICADCGLADFEYQDKRYFMCKLWKTRHYRVGAYHQGCQFSKTRFPVLFRYFVKQRGLLCKLTRILVEINDKIICYLSGAESF